MARLVTPGYVHHTASGDWDFEQFKSELSHVDTIYAARRYHVMHLVDDVSMVAAFLSWTGVRRADGSPMEGRGAYHCRVEGLLIAEDWDAFFPFCLNASPAGPRSAESSSLRCGVCQVRQRG